ncbi:hypothetical protein FEM48_Zijuj02G0061500 [Ziziphus jujuba var. spinosa]|uniref:DUF674 family protein n=1 Tax=Ziziphus jujuba var. spinosa TaxID=714518 RepID=A0A978VU29_ZIZJJ|nr:hypothetical protein FEM48_Zijuj02G0061500 [Ziziphus jujuba var. spinosa]
MANKQVDDMISLVVLVDKVKKKVIFAESDDNLVDTLFSFLTILLGTIIRLSCDKSAVEIGCMNNLYKSVENIEDKHFHSAAFKQMLLSPRNNAESHCSKLKLKIDHQITRYFGCGNGATCSGLLSHYKDCLCRCGRSLNSAVSMKQEESKTPSFSDKDGGVFVKGLSRFIISDDLQVMPLTTAASFSLFSKLGIMDGSGIEKNIFNLGIGEVLNLLVRSLVSKTPLTETLLKHKPPTELNAGNFDQGKPVEQKMEDEKNIRDGKITIKLMVSKSKKKVCYAGAKKDFVNLLFSFLTIPLGHFMKQKCSTSLNGCIDHLYKSVQDLDEQCLKSNYHKEMLVSPKLASGIGYENDLLEIEEASHPTYFFDNRTYRSYLTSDKSLIPSGLSIINDLKVPFNDIEEQTVLVGKEEVGDPLEKAALKGIDWTYKSDDKAMPRRGGGNAVQIIQRHHFASHLKRMAVVVRIEEEFFALLQPNSL